MTNDKNTGTVQVRPAAISRVYVADYARAELLVTITLLAEVSLLTVRLRMPIGWAHVNRPADLVTEKARGSVEPRTVPRDRRQAWPARIPYVKPYRETPPYPARTEGRAAPHQVHRPWEVAHSLARTAAGPALSIHI